MPKIMLVEDDNNLREIYGERLMAEGYEIVSAGDGEEALALAVKEKPDLIISDVMMPKISGFDMLDILRQTPETKFTKVIMMTALSQTEDKDRADRLGADKYLVKSQVTLEDVARVVHDLIYGNEEEPATDAAAPAEPAAATVTAAAAAVATEPTVAPVAPVAQEPVVAPAEPVVAPPAPEPVIAEPVASVAPVAPSTPAQEPVVNPITGSASAPVTATTQPLSAASVSDESAAITEQIDTFVATEPTAATSTQAPLIEPSEQDLIHAQNAVEDPEVIKPELPSEPAASVPPVMPEANEELEPASARKKVIQPISDPTAATQPNINELYEQEMAREAANSPITNPQVVAAPAQLPDNPISNPAPAAAPALETADASAIEGLTLTDQAAAPVAPAAQPQAPAPEKEDKVPDPNDPASFAL